MSTTPFTPDLLQAISDWQRGGDSKQIKRRGEKLKELCAGLPDEYRSAPSACFRQLALQKASVWDLIAKDFLPERISSWTLDSNVAKAFKGGVPPDGWQGVVLSIKAPPNGVIVNLWKLYKTCEFLDALDHHKHAISGFSEGAGRYCGTQCEIVIEVDAVSQDDIYSLGGYSSGFDDLVRQATEIIYGMEPTPVEVAELEWKSEHLRPTAGPRWLCCDGTKRVLQRTKPAAAVLRGAKGQEFEGR
jgi:hypothetical protein